VLAIRDNVRPEAVAAIQDVRSAGIQVVMVTGDRKETAMAIAREAGLLSEKSDVVWTSAELGDMDDDAVKAALPSLRVVARALPADKSRLVRLAQELDMVVGMTGDGVNDSPALKKADVGFAMGSGTEVAKEAGDITILDDNFISIRKAILYGRSMFKCIRTFLVFQLTVNVASVVACIIGPLAGRNVVLTVVQLLLINIVMDTLAAFAFGSEPARDEIMKERPVPRSQGIVTKSMLVQILWNLLGNDLKYAAPYGSVKAVFSRCGGRVRLELADEGQGMTKRQMKKAFNRYYRSRTVLESGKGGFGIGLCTAREFAEAMGGSLSVRANDPKGCVFTLELLSAKEI
jgi:magnesium-transporting ATPase (P-type)